MTFNEYQAAALRTAKPRQDFRERMMEGVLGLCGEAGEVADMVKKSAYQGHLMTTAGVAEELGDVLWYAALVAKMFSGEITVSNAIDAAPAVEAITFNAYDHIK